MRRIAIPVTEGKLSEYFGKCSHYLLYDISGNEIKETELQTPGLDDIRMMPEWAYRNEVTDIITHKLDPKIIMLFSQYKINLFVGISIDQPDALLEAFMKGDLVSDREIIKGIIESK